ncbi:DUF6884 domain-containing protein [Plantactinospora sp. CA-290183]|uniref:DUF6884 domain-containing protein n=1 Tax=Plantactinospora sp. CA-290183 TaxID=3240006 RepID=UPI003D8FB5F7
MSGMAAPAVQVGSATQRRLVIVCCCAKKADTLVPIPALDLYQEGPVPQLRARVGHRPDLRSRIRVLSAEHGIVGADTPLLPYDRPLDMDRAVVLRPAVTRALWREMHVNGVPEEVLVAVEPLYLVLLADLLAVPGVRIRWITDPMADWSATESVLKEWGWQ